VDDWVGIEGGHDGEVVGIDNEGYVGLESL